MHRAFLMGRLCFNVNLYVGLSLHDGRHVLVKASRWCTSTDEAMGIAMAYASDQFPSERTTGRKVQLIPMLMC